MKHKIIWLLLLLSCLSCKKFLDKKPDNALVVPDTVAGLQAILDDDAFLNYNTPSFGLSSCDDYFLNTETYNTLQAFEKNKYTWTPVDYTFQNDWSMAYRAIYPANLCLDRLNYVAMTAENEPAWNNVKGSALFYRAFYHLHLAWLFAPAYEETTAATDLGIVLRRSADFNQPSVRSVVRDSYAQIIDDARQAANYLPDHPRHSLRPSKAAAYALLARAYLSMRKYDSAGKYADLSLAVKNDLLDYNNLSDVNINAYFPFKQFNKETIFYTTMNNLAWMHSPLTGAKVDSSLYALYDEDDLRKITLFEPSSGYYAFKGSYSSDLIFLFSGITTAEVILIRAESHARKGNITAALSDLNGLLSKRWKTGTFTPVTTVNVAETTDLILQERRKELVMRDLRWMDVKRLNKEGAGIVLKRQVDNQTFLLPPNDKRFALPIPIDVIRNSGIQQN